MSSRKDLKKDVKKIFMMLYNDLVSYILLAETEQRKMAQAIFANIATVEKDVIHQLNVKPSKIEGTAKKYFTQLIDDTNKKINGIIEDISKLP